MMATDQQRPSALMCLHHSLVAQSLEGVKTSFEMIGPLTGNILFKMAGEHYEFHTAIIERDRLALGRAITKVFYRTSSIGNLQALLRNWGQNLLSIRGFADYQQTLIRKQFSLHPQEYVATLATWQHFLIAGMHGETPAARDVQQYLINIEVYARVMAYKEMMGQVGASIGAEAIEEPHQTLSDPLSTPSPSHLWPMIMPSGVWIVKYSWLGG